MPERISICNSMNMPPNFHGLDFDQEGLDILKKNGIGNLYQGDLENLQAVKLDETFDVIIAGEMIEHLNNPGLFLNGIKRFMTPRNRSGHYNHQCLQRFAVCILFSKRKRRHQRSRSSRSCRVLLIFDIKLTAQAARFGGQGIFIL